MNVSNRIGRADKIVADCVHVLCDTWNNKPVKVKASSISHFDNDGHITLLGLGKFVCIDPIHLTSSSE